MHKELRRQRFVKKVKKRIPWLSHVSDNAKDFLEITPSIENVKLRVPRGSLCPICRGSKLLCGKKRCPILVKFYSFAKISRSISTVDLEGSSPPDVFVGRIGYPYVYAGPLMPPFKGDTSLLSQTEHWLSRNISIDDVVDFRIKLVRGKFPVNVARPWKGGRLLEATRELALSAKCVDGEMLLKKPPSGSVLLSDDVQPMGPSAPVRDLKLYSVRTDPRLEKAFYDGDLLARDAVVELYRDGVYVSSIQRAFSVGAFGLEARRRLVPTRWSITAVDSIISMELRDAVVKQYEPIDEYRIYETYHLDNRFVVLMMPDYWAYELIEAWYPETLWNPDKYNISVCGDHEFYQGRRGYASIGGCYYAARLAVTEHLTREKRQARVVVLRESYPGYILPVGVWFVRESVRNALRRKPVRFTTLEEALSYIASRMRMKLNTWLEVSQLLKDTMKQAKMDKFLV